MKSKQIFSLLSIASFSCEDSKSKIIGKCIGDIWWHSI